MKPALCAFAATLFAFSAASAQTPAPTTPPQTKEPGQQNMVINPTHDECLKGWTANLKWSKPQFDQFCATLSKSK